MHDSATLLREADRRAAVATADGQPGGADTRALPHRLRMHLNAADLPEFVATGQLFIELREVNEYLDDAVRALDTLEATRALAWSRLVALPHRRYRPNRS